MRDRQSANQDTAISVTAYVHGQLKQRILSGVLTPGTAVLQEHLADELKVSRAPVREALKSLEGEGLLDFRPRRGYVVTELDVSEIEEIFDIRAMLEGKAGFFAAQKRTDEDLFEVARLLRKLSGITRRNPEHLSAWAAANRDFHTRMFLSSGRHHLCRMAIMLGDRVEQYVRIDALTPGRIEEADAEHAEIYAAFKRGDAPLVEQLSTQHCRRTCECLVSSLRSRGSKPPSLQNSSQQNEG